MSTQPIDLTPYFRQLESLDPVRRSGEVVELNGMVVTSRGPGAAIGDFCEIRASAGRTVRTQVVGFRDGKVLSVPLEEAGGVQLGDAVIARGQDARVRVGQGLLGRVLDGFGQPMDNGPLIAAEDAYDLYQPAGNPLDREHITQPLATGIRSIDSMIPCGKGQRIGIFGGSGVGKSTLLGAMSRHNFADVTVIALIGERNREVRAFLEHDLGPEGMKRSVVVCSTSDQPAPLRIRACFVALAVAEYFRDRGADVLLVMDSVTRLAMAQREIGLAAASRPARKVILPPSSGCCRKSVSAPVIFGPAPSPDSSLFSWRATISMSPSVTPSDPYSTATSCCHAVWPRVDSIPLSMFSNRSAGSAARFQRANTAKRRGVSANPWPSIANPKT
jgi:FliI/YscN family ATPase